MAGRIRAKNAVGAQRDSHIAACVPYPVGGELFEAGSRMRRLGRRAKAWSSTGVEGKSMTRERRGFPANGRECSHSFCNAR